MRFDFSLMYMMNIYLGKSSSWMHFYDGEKHHLTTATLNAKGCNIYIRLSMLISIMHAFRCQAAQVMDSNQILTYI